MILGSVNLIETLMNLREMKLGSISARHHCQMRRHCGLDTCFNSEWFKIKWFYLKLLGLLGRHPRAARRCPEVEYCR